MVAFVRDGHGRYSKVRKKTRKTSIGSIVIDHNYAVGNVCDGPGCEKDCGAFLHRGKRETGHKQTWKEGRRIVEFDVLLNGLESCEQCRLGPVPLTKFSVIDEKKVGLSGYLYVQCQNIACGHVNRVAYGKTHRMKKGAGMPCFAVNTKVGAAMIDSIGGPVRVNNFLASLNIPTMSTSNLKKMERRAGEVVEKVAQRSTKTAAKDAFLQEMEEVAKLETDQAESNMECLISDLGVSAMEDSSPSVKKILQHEAAADSAIHEAEWTDDEETIAVKPAKSNIQSLDRARSTRRRSATTGMCRSKNKIRRKLDSTFPCRTRTGMTCAVDTAWHKRGFDSLTSHTFFMSHRKYGKKVIKSIVSHRTCGTCKWWRANRPGKPIRKHRCVHTHTGSARLMESVSGEIGVKELMKEGTPIEYLEGDGDNTLISRLKNNLGIDMKKRFDKNHVVKNIGKKLYGIHHTQGVKLSKNVIVHIQKCLKYAFSKHAGDKVGLKENLEALIPHQFGDHSLCHDRFCGYKRNTQKKYEHRSLPYKGPLKDENNLRSRLEEVFTQVANNSEQYSDLGSSQQCEHANREVTLRAPKSLHYGNSESLDFRVHATAAFINQGRHYIPESYFFTQ